jgi:hypothetical protein
MGNNLEHLAVGLTYPILLFVLFYTAGAMDEPVLFSPDAFVQPYLGENNIIISLLTFMALLDIHWYFSSLLPKLGEDRQNKLIAVTFPSAIAVFGFVIGFLESNPWVALPFFLVGFGIYMNAYIRFNPSD